VKNEMFRIARHHHQPRRSLLQIRSFRLDSGFVSNFENKKAPFGFNGLGELVYHRTYARTKVCGGREKWFETAERVVNGTFSMKERWMLQNHLGWDEPEAQRQAQEMYERMFSMKFLPPGRGLWCMGTSVTEERGLFAALNNCAFVSTDSIDVDLAEPFCFTMDASMLGVGVGFDTVGAGKVNIIKPKNKRRPFIVPDSREGWVDSLRELLLSFTSKASQGALDFDYSKIRAAGKPIKGFGGTSSGPAPLIALHRDVESVLESHHGKPISVTAIVDIMNMIGRCVVAGNVRRTAEIAFGDAESLEYIELKNYTVNPQRAEYGWTSNNSVFARLGMDYKNIVERIVANGEPGFAWLDNMRNFGRMNGTIDRRDWRAKGGNPCLEQTLESHELCCLVETFPDHHDNVQDYKKTLASAFLYAKIVTLGKTHWPKSNKVMLRNRRIGTSMSGISQFITSRGIEQLREWCEQGYTHIQECDEAYSEELAIPKSIKTTCVKPSGTVSLLAGATPGIHMPESRFYIRRVRINRDSELIAPLTAAGYHLEPAESDPSGTLVVSIPIDSGPGLRTSKDTTLWEQLSLAAFMQRHWADNQVSCTVTFDPLTEAKSLAPALDMFQYQLKGISFLPRLKAGAYAQMPYEEIEEETFVAMSKAIGDLNLKALNLKNKTTTRKRAMRVLVDVPEDSLSSLSVDDGVALNNLMPDSFCDAAGCYNEKIAASEK